MKYSYIIFLCLAFNLGLTSNCFGQNNTKKKSTLKLAHDRKINKDEFTKTDKGLFNAKVYNVNQAEANKVHHWFLKLTDLDGWPINFADVELEGYLKNDPSIKFNYINPIFKLCSEGKYIIGFVKVKNSGIWVLDLTIDNFGKKDTISYEISIGDFEL